MKIRNFIRNSILDVNGYFAKPAKGVHLLNGHMIHRVNPQKEIFLDQLKEIRNFATFIRIEDAVQLITDRKEVNDTLIAFTFDDGFEECASMIAPALEEFDTNALFFINPNFVEGDDAYVRNFTEHIVLTPGKQPMRWNQIMKLHESGHIIGAHTLDHFMINSNNLDELKHQIVDCKSIIENKLNSECKYFAFPFGRLEHANSLSIDIAIKYYKYIFSQSDYKNYFSYNGKVINRRHFEPYWPVDHVKYFVSHKKKY
jgi:peptidoglycan/xylan/chitin deacetylase (PgdA/CDA1 family)